MLRKIALALLAAASMAAVAPTAASAHGMHGGGHGMHGGHWGGGFGYGRFHRSSFFFGGSSCYKTVFSEFGPRRINVCNAY